MFAIGVFMLIRELLTGASGAVARWQRSLIVGYRGGGDRALVHAALDSSLRESALAILLVLCGGSDCVGRTADAQGIRFRLCYYRFIHGGHGE